ncbi:hypothetical protein ACEUEC_13640 [Aeromonas veronii]
MKIINTLENYTDDNGNKIVFNKKIDTSVNIRFTGKNNTLVVSDDASPSDLLINFDCDNGRCEIGRTRGRFNIRIGQDSTVIICDDVSTTQRCFISAAEGSTVNIGKDCMISVGVSIRTDDSHAIFDVESGLRINISQDVIIGNHVWIGQEVAILGGTSIGDGSVIGFRSVVKGKIENNCIAVGIPSRVVRKNIAWERPHLTLAKPYYKPDSSCVKKSEYWNLTEVNSDC